MNDVPEFKTERPPRISQQRIYIVARDPDEGVSRSVTLYGITPEQFVEAIRSMGEGRQKAEPTAA